MDFSKYTKLVTHANCADGLASALLARAVNPQIEVVFVNYGDPSHMVLAPSPEILWVDMTPARGNLPESGELPGACIDHHKTQRETCERFQEHQYGEEAPGVSGASLFLELLLGTYPALLSSDLYWLVSITTIYDSWDRESPDWHDAVSLTRALLFWGWEELSSQGLPLPHQLLWLGERLQSQQEDQTLRNAQNTQYFPEFSVECYGISRTIPLAIFQGGSPAASSLSEYLATRGTAYLTVGFTCLFRNGEPGYLLSLRSAPDPSGYQTDVSAIARRIPGGGGHPGAAGCWVLSLGRDPWSRILEVLCGV